MGKKLFGFLFVMILLFICCSCRNDESDTNVTQYRIYVYGEEETRTETLCFEIITDDDSSYEVNLSGTIYSADVYDVTDITISLSSILLTQLAGNLWVYDYEYNNEKICFYFSRANITSVSEFGTLEDIGMNYYVSEEYGKPNYIKCLGHSYLIYGD